MDPKRFTLAQLFGLTALVVAVAVAATFYVFLESSQRSIVEHSDKSRDDEAKRIKDRVSTELGVAEMALEDIERALHAGTLLANDRASVEAVLYSEIVNHPQLSDATLTRATKLGYALDGRAILDTAGRTQTTVFRASPDHESAIYTRQIALQNGHFAAYLRRRAQSSLFADVPFEDEPNALDANDPDPTSHLTFETTVSKKSYGRAIWSDLSRSELDAGLPMEKRRVVVTVQKAIEDIAGHFVGVARVGMLTNTIDELPRMGSGDQSNPERVFLCDGQGQLVTRLDPRDPLQLLGDDLRVVPQHTPSPIKAALATPFLRELSRDHPARSTRFESEGGAYLASFRTLENSQEWIVGIVVPEGYYTQDLRALRSRLLVALLVACAVALASGGFALAQVRSSLRRILAATARMRAFDFAPSRAEAPFRDVAEVMDGMERAKTSMRALGKYVPVDLVRQFYDANREPELGGELVDLSLMFTDIEGFTSLSEELTPDALAQALGKYLEVMIAGVRSTHGTVDKFIGDAVMAFWNAPTRCSDHARRACLAVLACMRATRELYASPAWTGLKPLFTRFGLHTARVMVGHFGAPERLSYTALGDGVNLASRLEALCKQYGVAVLASEAVVRAAGDEMAFRFVDRVAVKGKQQSVNIHELLGLRAECAEALASARAYERALASYFARDFAGALEVLRARKGDPPSRVLAERCETMIQRPPDPDWNGVYVATSK